MNDNAFGSSNIRSQNKSDSVNDLRDFKANAVDFTPIQERLHTKAEFFIYGFSAHALQLKKKRFRSQTATDSNNVNIFRSSRNLIMKPTSSPNRRIQKRI